VNCEAVRVYTLQFCVTACDLINPVVNRISVLYIVATHARDNILK
jgi:hypothetical protein